MKGGEWMHFYYGTQYIYLHNLQGDVVGLVDTAGALVVEYKYDAWGRIIGRSGSLVSTLGYLNPFRYRGYVYDEETGLYYLRSRYYNPEWGRFVNADVLLGECGTLLSHNLFAYCLENPIALDHSNGNWPEWAIELGNRVKHVASIGWRILTLLPRVCVIEMGIGVGLGVSVSVKAHGIPIEASIGFSNTDYLVYDDLEPDIRHKTVTNKEIKVANCMAYSATSGLDHSYDDPNCTCDFMRDSFAKKSQCPANKALSSQETAYSISVGGYFLLGAEFSVTFKPNDFAKELRSIYYDSISYGR